MRPPTELDCPTCGKALELHAERDLLCACGFHAPALAGTWDLRRSPDEEPLPFARGELDAPLVELEHGRPFKAVLEELLHAAQPDVAELAMQLLRESRGAWAPLLHGRDGRALLIANALSGTAPALAAHGFDVTVLDASPERLRFGWARTEAQMPGCARGLLADDLTHLPFADASIDVVILERGLPADAAEARRAAAELRRVASDELVLIADNRLAYKRSLGRRGAFHVPSPIEFLKRAVRPPAGERTLWGYRSALRSPELEPPRVFALYPHSREFAQVVAVGARGPHLAVGPMERKNRWKTAALRVGLFPVLTPSFGLFARRRGASRPVRTRLARILAELAERLDEPCPSVDHLIATRDNAAVVLTACEPGAGDDPAGRWVLHLPLGAHQLEQIPRHDAALRHVRARFPDLPVPEPLFHGVIEGLELSCERRLGGWTAPQLTGNLRCTRRMLAESARHLARLASPPTAVDERDFEHLLGSKIDLVMRHARDATTLAWFTRVRDELHERLVGRDLPRAYCHGDLRSKHVQVDADGRILGYLDWGTACEADVPYYDLFHLVAHERKQEAGLTTGAAWRLARERSGLRDHERAALDDYAARVGLDEDARSALELAYPVFVAHVAERNWDYSRPRWVSRQFQL